MQRHQVELGVGDYQPFGRKHVLAHNMAACATGVRSDSIGPFAKWRPDFDNITSVRAYRTSNDSQRDSSTRRSVLLRRVSHSAFSSSLVAATR